MKKKETAWIMAALCAVIVCWAGASIFGDTVPRNPSWQPSTNIGAWYDEDWNATGFYRLERRSEPGRQEEFEYRYTASPTTSGAPVFRKENATIPQDMIVTEWNVTGHVHFASDI